MDHDPSGSVPSVTMDAKEGSPFDEGELLNVHRSLDNQTIDGDFVLAMVKSAQKGKEKVEISPNIAVNIQRGVRRDRAVPLQETSSIFGEGASLLGAASSHL